MQSQFNKSLKILRLTIIALEVRPPSSNDLHEFHKWSQSGCQHNRHFLLALRVWKELAAMHWNAGVRDESQVLSLIWAYAMHFKGATV